MIAALPMYDLPEIRAETDRLWVSIRDALRDAGFAAPDQLTRPIDDPWPHWRDPGLTVSQTCGLPFAAKLSGTVTLLGTPDYDLPHCGQGEYYSEIIVHADNPAKTMAGLRGGRFAYNMRESQSGWAAPNALLGLARQFDALVETGSHAASAAAVAEGRADVAAIDAVTWALLQRHHPATKDIRVIGRTQATPGLPYISRKMAPNEAVAMRDAVAAGIEALDNEARAALLLKGFAPKTAEDYAPLAKGWGAA
ncbi:MAG: phosphate/phosphite/phosphonate ABC transporter substrate-binding protein [Pikeienuella sp.]